MIEYDMIGYDRIEYDTIKIRFLYSSVPEGYGT